MKKFVIAGCSLTSGVGWNKNNLITDVKDEPLLWTNLCHNNISRFRNLELINVGQGGASNSEIFQNAVRAIASHADDIDTVLCQWTSGPRYNFNVGFELWDTSEVFVDSVHRKHDVCLSDGSRWPRKYINDLIDRLRTLHHLHWEIVKILDYSNILQRLAQLHKFNIFFINGLCPWDDDYFVELHNVSPEAYTPFTKKDILNIDSRSDKDIHKLYHLAHTHYQNTGGINLPQWINLYNSYYKLTTDFNFDNCHPGQHSNQTFFNVIEAQLQSLNYI